MRKNGWIFSAGDIVNNICINMKILITLLTSVLFWNNILIKRLTVSRLIFLTGGDLFDGIQKNHAEIYGYIATPPHKFAKGVK